MNPLELSQYKYRLARSLRLMSWILWIIAGLVTGMVGFSFHYGNEMSEVYAPLIDASLEIKLKATAAHMQAQEILAGDGAKSAVDVWRWLDEADWYARAMLEGGKNPDNIISPLADAELRRIAASVAGILKEFRAIAQYRLSQRAIAGVGTESDRHYDRLYAVFTREADEVKRRLQMRMREDLGRFRTIQITLMLSLIVMFGVRAVAFHRFEQFRERNLQALQTANDQLEQEIQERRRAESELILSGEQLRNLSNQLQTIRENEKKRIAREVHDELGQTITALKMELVCLQGDIGRGAMDALRRRADTMHALIASVFSSVQRIITELRPQILDVLGLYEAMDWHVREYEKRTGIRCRLSLLKNAEKPDPELSTALFRIMQETLTNVARHAEAAHVDISLQEQDRRFIYRIDDDGKGMDENRIDTCKSIGLLGVRERVRAWGGSTVIESSPGKGTSITVTIPRPACPT